MLLDSVGSKRCATALLMALLLGLMRAAVAQDDTSEGAAAEANRPPADTASAPESSAESDLAQANNPLANFTALNFHDYYTGDITDPDEDSARLRLRLCFERRGRDSIWNEDGKRSRLRLPFSRYGRNNPWDEDANQFWVRFATPFSLGQTNWLMRASLPLNTSPVAPDFDHETGLGDLNVFAAYLVDTGNPAISFGIGPQVTLPTATEDALGSEKWSAGLVNTLFVATSKEFQYGYLLSWQASFAGTDRRDDVNVGAFQPFVFYQLGSGVYLRSTGVMSYNFENDTYSVPVGLGIGKVIRRPKVIYNIFVEPQVSVADEGAGWPDWQLFVGLNNQF